MSEPRERIVMDDTTHEAEHKAAFHVHQLVRVHQSVKKHGKEVFYQAIRANIPQDDLLILASFNNLVTFIEECKTHPNWKSVLELFSDLPWELDTNTLEPADIPNPLKDVLVDIEEDLKVLIGGQNLKSAGNPKNRAFCLFLYFSIPNGMCDQIRTTTVGLVSLGLLKRVDVAFDFFP